MSRFFDIYNINRERERLRCQRIIQVREQSRRNSSIIRHEVETERQHQIEKLARNVKNDLKLVQDEKVKELQSSYEMCLHSIGEGHEAAESQPSVNMERQALMVLNNENTEERSKAAMEKMKQERAERHCLRSRQLRSRFTALEMERKRAAQISALPPPPPDPVTKIAISKPTKPVGVTDVSAFSSTHYHIPRETLVYRRSPQDMTAPDAHTAAIEETKNREELTRTKAQTEQVTMERARLRHLAARKKENLKLGYNEMLHDLSDLQRADKQRRQRELGAIPKQVYIPSDKRICNRDERKRCLEHKFEDHLHLTCGIDEIDSNKPHIAADPLVITAVDQTLPKDQQQSSEAQFIKSGEKSEKVLSNLMKQIREQQKHSSNQSDELCESIESITNDDAHSDRANTLPEQLPQMTVKPIADPSESLQTSISVKPIIDVSESHQMSLKPRTCSERPFTSMNQLTDDYSYRAQMEHLLLTKKNIEESLLQKLVQERKRKQRVTAVPTEKEDREGLNLKQNVITQKQCYSSVDYELPDVGKVDIEKLMYNTPALPPHRYSGRSSDRELSDGPKAIQDKFTDVTEIPSVGHSPGDESSHLVTTNAEVSPPSLAVKQQQNKELYDLKEKAPRPVFSDEESFSYASSEYHSISKSTYNNGRNIEGRTQKNQAWTRSGASKIGAGSAISDETTQSHIELSKLANICPVYSGRTPAFIDLDDENLYLMASASSLLSSSKEPVPRKLSPCESLMSQSSSTVESLAFQKLTNYPITTSSLYSAVGKPITSVPVNDPKQESVNVMTREPICWVSAEALPETQTSSINSASGSSHSNFRKMISYSSESRSLSQHTLDTDKTDQSKTRLK